MAGTIVSGTITTGIVLDDPATEGILTVTATGRISNVDADAIFGTTAFPWTVNNKGTIQNTGTTGDGIQLVQGGTVNNQVASALIEGYYRGVLIKGAAGSVTNLGTIRGTGIDSRGINLSDGGRVVNGSAAVTGALIAGGRQGVFINGATGTVSNFGTIASTSSHSGVVLNAGGAVTNGAANSTVALITGPGTAVYVNNGVGTVANFGSIRGSTGVFLRRGGNVANGLPTSTASTITGTSGNAVRIDLATGTVTNFGTINATGTVSAVSVNGGGRVINGSAAATGALITSTGTGVLFSHLPGTVTNFGTIAATSVLRGNGVTLFDGGDVINSGIISNLGSTSATVYILGGGSVTNTNIGLISGVSAAIVFRGSPGTVTNAGSIKSSSSSGVYVNGGGIITNESGGRISGQFAGVYGRGVAISVTNDGTINTTGTTNAIYLRGGGNIVNGAVGTIVGAAAGVRFGGAAGAVVNAGFISGAIGVYNTGSGDLTLTNSGTIASTLGTAGSAVILGNSVGNNLLVVEAGSTFIGAVKGGGNAEIDFVPGGVANMASVSGFATVGLGNGVSHTLTLTDANFTGVNPNRITVLGGDSGNIVNASTVALNLSSVIFVGGAGTDKFTGGAFNDFFEFSTATLTGADVVAGKSGSGDRLVMTSAGVVTATGVTGVEIFQLADGGANSLSLANANFTGTSGGFIRVYGGNGGNTVDGSGVTTAAGHQLVMYGGAGTDSFTGGAGNDVFVFAATNLGSGDIVSGGGGNDELLMTSAGAINAGGVSGVETFALTSGGANTLTLTDANFAGVTGASIRVVGGNAGNTVNASTLTAPNRIAYTGGAGADNVTGGAGNDIFFAAGNTTMAGGAGGNRFTFADIGANSITDFGLVGATNALVLRDAGFNLGVNEGTGTASLQHLAAGVFVANATGTFTTTGQRFAYNTATGDLRYDRDGSGGTFGASSVAVLTDHAGLAAGAAGNVFFTS